MPSNDDFLTDDYVAELLASEAKDASIKYSAMGLDAFKSSSKPTNKLKPNTRFLRHLIKETTNHNAALLAKEHAESQARLQEFSDAEERRRKRHKPEPTEVRRRQLAGIKSILNGQPSARHRDRTTVSEISRSRELGDRTSGSDDRPRRSKHDRRYGRESNDRGGRRVEDYHSGSDREPEHRHRSRRRLSNSSEEEDRYHRRRRGRDYSRSRSRSPRRRGRKYRDRSSDEHESKGPGNSRPRHKDMDKHRHEYELDICRRTSNNSPKESPLKAQADESDSDPLEDLIGPLPATHSPGRPRGRGAQSAASGIDRRFSASYDPKADLQPGSDEDDWDDAVEAYRDLAKWKQQGASRLRAAGFTELQVRKWESGGERRPEDVKWSKKGEKREWDRGKVLAPDGTVSQSVDWDDAAGTLEE